VRKKWLLALLLLFGITSVAGCSTINRYIKKNDKATITSTSLMNQEKLYSELSRNANYPKMLKHSEHFNKEQTFIIKISESPSQLESKDETLNGEWYVPAFLMRNQDVPIYLNLSSIKQELWPKTDEIVKITGTPIGYLYTSYNNERLDLLDVKVKRIERVKGINKKVSAEKIIETDQYRVEFTGTDTLLDTFGDPSLIVYYNFKNKKEFASISPLKTFFNFSQNEEVLERTILDGDNKILDSKALQNDVLEPDEEMLYYVALKLKDTSRPVVVRVYNDEYRLLNELELLVSKIREH
jgi:hypothetical protein